MTNQETPTINQSGSVTDSWKSALWWITGTVMWVAVFVLLYLKLSTASPVLKAKSTGDTNGIAIQATSQGVQVKTELQAGYETQPAFIEDFTLTNRTGKTVTNMDLKGKPWVCNFIFTKCIESCPMITGKMRDLAKGLDGAPVNFVSFTIDPKNDTPEQLTTYAEIHQADLENWYFLTGDRSKIYDIIQKNFLTVIQEQFDAPAGYEFAHSNRFFHVDAQGKIVGSYLGTDDAQLALLTRVIKEQSETPASHQFFHTRKIDGYAEEPLTTVQVQSTEKLSQTAAPEWVTKLPLVNTTLNALAGVLLLMGLIAIKTRNPEVHKKFMLSAFGVSVAFLICYLSYHFSLHYFTGEGSRKYTGVGLMRTIYFVILISHVILAALVPVLALVTIHQGIRHNWKVHRRWAKITFPIWMYVSITGVVVYVMLYSA